LRLPSFNRNAFLQGGCRLGNNESYFLVALKKTNEEPNADYHLSFTMRGEMNFFRDQKWADNWGARLDYFDQIGKSLSPIFEAVYFYGKELRFCFEITRKI